MRTSLIIIFMTGFSLLLRSQESLPEILQPETDPVILEKIENWKDLKFGLLMHWGTYSQWGIVESWSLCSEDEPWCTRKMKNYVDYCREYARLIGTFNPVAFDPVRWADAARYAGMKYMVFTTKHHDGFCMFDTRQTNYKITSPDCPFHNNPKSDVTRELFNAFRDRGFWVGAYFSKPDWHSNDYWAEEWATPNRNVNYAIQKYPDRWKRFREYTFNQIEELATGYGKLDILWLDGGWVNPGNGQDINMPEIARMARKHQPGLLIVDRTVTGKYENYRTPEQEIPESVPDYPWETCMTMATSWSYVPNDIYKPTNRIIHNLVDIVCKGGNYLLNIGPSPEGTWSDTAYARLKEIGDWMKINGEAIYHTRPVSPYKSGKICFTAGTQGILYAIYLAGPEEKQMPGSMIIHGIKPSEKTTVHLLGWEKPLRWKTNGDQSIEIVVPSSCREKPPCAHAWTFRFSSVK